MGVFSTSGVFFSGVMESSGVFSRSGIFDIPSESAYDPDALDYFERAEALGGSFDLGGAYTEEAVKGSWNAFVLTLKSDGTWDELDEIFPGCGVTFAGATAKLKHSGNPVVTLSNFVSGDYVAAGSLPGFKGDGLTKSINSNWMPSSTITIPSCHHSVFTTEEIVLTGDNLGVDGATTITSVQTISTFMPFVDGTVYSDMFSEAGGRISAATPYAGSMIFNATNAAHRMIHDGSLVVSGASPTGVVPTTDFLFFRRNTTDAHSAIRAAVRTMGQGLNEEQESTLNNAIQELMSSLGYSAAP